MKFNLKFSTYFCIFLLALSSISFIALVMHNPTDISLFYYDDVMQTKNTLGFFGANISAILLFLFGGAAYYLTFLLFLIGLLRITAVKWMNDFDQIIAAFALLPCWSIFAAYYSFDMTGVMPGGFIGQGYVNFIKGSNNIIVYAGLFHVIALACILIATRLSLVRPVSFIAQTRWMKIVKRALHIMCVVLLSVQRNIQLMWLRYMKMQEVEEEISPNDFVWAALEEFEGPVDDTGVLNDPFWKAFAGSEKKEAVSPDRANAPCQPKVAESKNSPASKLYRVPPISLLASGTINTKKLDDALKQRAKIVEEKLAHFGVKGEVVSITPGPVVTLFEFQPAIDIKVSRIIALEDDLALALKAHSLRIIAPIPGKSVVGFEVANTTREILFLAPLINSGAFKSDTSYVPIVLGHDTIGAPIIIDVAAAPHLLIAGSTGSGKSVALNVMLTSMLYRRTPEELRFVLIDPKRLEFATYADIPHLLCPIVTHPSKAVLVLKWVLKTMEERYEHMAEIGVRNILDYKEWCKAEGHIDDMPFIVVMIDELADLMLVAGGDIEDLLARIAQMARAAGIHLIVATQRPSVDVITGVVKVNFPSRIAFKVASKIDSRTILDAPGAEKLLGKGDMLYLASNGSLSRLHGAYISAQEISRVVDHVKKQSPVAYTINLEMMKQDADEKSDDPLYGEVVSYVQTLEEISISHLQRKFRIGYNRSARIIDMLENANVIMPADGGKMRKVIH